MISGYHEDAATAIRRWEGSGWGEVDKLGIRVEQGVAVRTGYRTAQHAGSGDWT